MTIIFNNLKKCETCLGGGQLIQDSGPMRGYIIACPDCAGSWKDFSNQYGTDSEDSPEVYIDEREGIFGVVKDKKGGYFRLLDGREIAIDTTNPFEK